MPQLGINILGTLRNADFLKKGMAALLVFFVLIKGLIPVGYMPDMQALRDGLVKITICTAYGSQELLVDGNGQAQDGKQQHQSKSDFCPFAWGVHSPHQFIAPVITLSLLVLSESFLAFQKLFLAEPHHTLSQPRAPPAII